MTSGIPFSDREKRFIREHAGSMSNGMIAQQLGRMFAEDNGGYRSYRSIRTFLFRERKAVSTIIELNIPNALVQVAYKSGRTLDDIAEIAKRAIEGELTR